MTEVILKLPDDFSWIIKNKEGMKWVESSIINKLTEIKIGNLLSEKSKIKEEDLGELDQVIKRALYKKIKG